MFGESDSESPRVPSPWDCLISAPPSPAARAQSPSAENIPKLVPEAEEGNVEYKLQLLDPSPARFVRLVTQMKWRLLEGGGQAYYELGVADDGALVGLHRAELDRSLETLEMMAGEIGASVIVVKEVEVPAAMAGSAASETDYWNGKRRRRRSVYLSDTIEGDSTTENEIEAQLKGLDATADMLPGSSPDLTSLVTPPSHTPDLDVGETNQCLDTPAPSMFSTDLEISSVFKPLPVRNRNYHSVLSADAPAVTMASRSQSLANNNLKPTAEKSHDDQHCPPSFASDSTTHTPPKSKSVTQTKQEAKLLHRSQARERKRSAKQKGLTMPIDTRNDVAYITCTSEDRNDDSKPNPASPNLPLSSFHVPGNMSNKHCQTASIPMTDLYSIPGLQLEGGPFITESESPEPPSPNTCTPGPSQLPSIEPRLIVEALIVRKMAIEEAFLDFSGFSLT